MSWVCRCINNGPMERFCEILKAERYHLKKFHDYESPKYTIEKYMNYYNKIALSEMFKMHDGIRIS